MRILITGGDGFIGSHLADEFRAGHEVAVLDNWETGLERPGTYECDVGSFARFRNFATRVEPELVIHCAASYKDPDDWQRDVDTNTIGTINAVRVAKHHGAKLVYFQTGLPPISSYAISKIAGEHYIRQSGVPHLIFRLANVYGPRNLSGPIPAFYKRLAAGEPCTVAQTTRDLVYIDDLVDCVTESLVRGLIGTYDVCTGVQTPIASIYGEVAAYFDSVPMASFVGPTPDDVLPQVDPAHGVPDWYPVVTLHDGISVTVAWYEEHGVAQTYTHLALKG